MDGRSTFAIINAALCDGTGRDIFCADVVVQDGIIRAVEAAGKLNLCGTETVTPPDDLLLAPGFIDVHSHSDQTLMRYPESESRITQGFTTEIIGQCGDSAYICDAPEVKKRLEEETGVFPVWHDLRTYVQELQRRHPAVNYAAMAGAGSARECVCGMDDRPLSPAEMCRMKNLLADALSQGAIGISSGLVYLPGRFAGTAELQEAAALLQPGRKLYSTHLRSEAEDIIPALKEAAAVARQGGGRLQISHLKTMGKANWHKLDEVLQEIKSMQNSGLTVHADRYPYIHAASSLRLLLPPPWSDISDLPDFLRNPENRSRMIAALEKANGLIADWDGVILAKAALPHNLPLVGRSMAETAAECGVSPAAVFVNILAGEAHPGGQFRCMCQENLDRILDLPFVMAGSDSSGVPLDPSGPRTHPRAFGTAGRFFHQLSGRQGITEAVRRMTSLAADSHRLSGRGRIAAGYAADMVLFDPEKFNAATDFADPRKPADGIDTVWVNGCCAFDRKDPERRERGGVFLGN